MAASAEVRAVWQRAANRCFVQEDAKRAPKLASYQSNPTTPKHADPQQPTGVSGSDHSSSAFMPFDQIPPFPAFPIDTRWWLWQEPGYGFPRCLTSQQRLSSLGVKDRSGDPDYESIDMTVPVDQASALECLSGDLGSEELMGSMELEESYEMVQVCREGWCTTASKKTDIIRFDADGPWWRMADGSELASFVALRSSDHLQNCDLPPPQRVRIRKPLSSPQGSHDHQEDAKDHRRTHQLGSSRNSCGTVSSPSSADSGGGGGIADLDPYRTQLLEALCHSQTRAREAEMALKQAIEEKERVIELFCRQASQLFAYKQWFQLLQLEATASKRVSTYVHVLLPPVLHRGKRAQNRSNKGPRHGQGRRNRVKNDDIGKYAAVFSVGLGLVGAGLILGWTVGWMLPLF